MKSTNAALVFMLLFSIVNCQVDFDDFYGEEFPPKESSEDHGYEKELHLSKKISAECAECSCPPIPQCDAGVSLVTDGCGCCRVCAKQLGERCDTKNVCDHHKGLHCDHSTKTCKARPGRSCRVADKWYENGELFSPNCLITCYCTDGDLACKSKCQPAPPGCRYPKRVHSSSNCCGQWKCSNHQTELGRVSNSLPEINGACEIQSTEWSPCSRTCGYGVSERITNNNDECKLKKEERICIIRPCKGDMAPRKSKRSCRKSLRHSRRIRISMNGCHSVKMFKPKYCGTCRHSSKCCRPHSTKTVDMEFRCEEEDGSFSRTTKKFMSIHSCECGNFCSQNENDIFSNFHSLRNDNYRS